MARYIEIKVTLTAAQAAGTDPILAAESGAVGSRSAVVFGNPTAATANLHLNTGQLHGTGMPVVGYSTASLDEQLPGLNNALYVTGMTAGDTVPLWVA